jgi:hypothetical protein
VREDGMAHFHQQPNIEKFQDFNKLTNVKDRALCAAEMFVYAVDRASVLAICLAGEKVWLKTCKTINAYEGQKFAKEDLKAIFRMICDIVSEDLKAIAPDVKVHV